MGNAEIKSIACAPHPATRTHLPDRARAAFAVCVADWTMNRRPLLPQLAADLLADKDIALDETGQHAVAGADLSAQERALVTAIMKTAARAEINQAVAHDNDFHNPVHTAHVAVMAGYLGDLNDHLVEGYGRFVEYTIREKLTILLAAFAHDLDHPGRPNPDGAPTHNEEAALAVLQPILDECGVHPRDTARLRTMIVTTSPNGPHAVLKKIAHAHAHRERVDAHAAAPFPELAVLAKDRELTQMAAILSDADLFASAGTGLDGNAITSRRLTEEFARAGQNVDFTTPQACAGFIQHVIGRDGFASQAARAGFNRAFRSFVVANDDRLRECRPG